MRKERAQEMGIKVVKNFVIDPEMAEDLERLSVTRGKSQSLLVREALRPFLAEQKVAS